MGSWPTKLWIHTCSWWICSYMCHYQSRSLSFASVLLSTANPLQSSVSHFHYRNKTESNCIPNMNDTMRPHATISYHNLWLDLRVSQWLCQIYLLYWASCTQLWWHKTPSHFTNILGWSQRVSFYCWHHWWSDSCRRWRPYPWACCKCKKGCSHQGLTFQT